MSDIQRSDSFQNSQKSDQHQNNYYCNQQDSNIEDIKSKISNQYSVDNRDYYDLYIKRDSIADDNGFEDINQFNKDLNNQSLTDSNKNNGKQNNQELLIDLSLNSSILNATKNPYMVKALQKLSKRDSTKLQSPISVATKTGIRVMKNRNGSLLIEKESSPKRVSGENYESFFKYMAASGQECQDCSLNNQQNQTILNQTQFDFTVQGGEDAIKYEVNACNDTVQEGICNQFPSQHVLRKEGTMLQRQAQKEIKIKKILSDFNKLNNIKKFVKKMTSLSPQYNYRRLRDFHFEVIGDVIQVITSKIYNERFNLATFILKPNEIFSIMWEVFEILFIFFHVIAFGFRFGFGIVLNYYIKIFSICFLLADLIIIINTGYYQGVEIVTTRVKIIKYNLFNISMILLSLIALVFNDQGPLELVFIFRIKWLYQSYYHFEQNFQLKQKHPVSETLLRLFIIIILLAHYNACGYFFFSQNYNSSDQTWLQFYNLQNQDWEIQYITALYFSFITMVTVGYGDIVPKTVNERIYVIFFVLISAITFAYVVNTIGALFQELSRQEGKYNQKKFEIVNYMEERKISKSIQISVVKFLEFTIKQEKELQYSLSGENFLQSIPQKLRQQVYQEYYGRILQEIKLFSMNFSKDFLQSLSVLMKEKTYGPGEEIFKQGEKNSNFFFINKGQIEFDIEVQGKNNISLGFLKKGDSFNHQGLFVDKIHEVTARCKQITQIIFLNQEDFQRILKQNKDEYEKYCMIRDKYLQESITLGEQCLSCLNYSHSVLNCNLIRYMPNKPNLIAKEQYNIPVLNRCKKKRFLEKKQNSLVNNQEVKQALRLLRIQLTYMIMGDRLGTFQDLINRNFSDNQFFRYFPQLQMNSDKYIEINSMEELKYSFEDLDTESLIFQNPPTVCLQNNQINQGNNLSGSKESNYIDNILLKVAKTQNNDQQNFQSLQAQQINEQVDIILSPLKKNLWNNLTVTSDLEQDDESQKSSSDKDLSSQRDKIDKCIMKMPSLKTSAKEINQNPQLQQQKQQVNRRISIMTHNPILIQQQANSNQDIYSTNTDLVQMQQNNNNNMTLLQIINQLQMILHNSQNQNQNLSVQQNQNQLFSNQNKKNNIVSMTQIKIDPQPSIISQKGQFMHSFNIIPSEGQQNQQNHNQNNQQNNNLINSAGLVHNYPNSEKHEKFQQLCDFDLIKEYKYYFPFMNYSQTIFNYNQSQDITYKRKCTQLNKKQ
ncbi:cation channel family protein (macronuclear) [Tetrahymena thermophila SB210]|uniref:Cation channel family protein n=1 Tax=Tetrahymena thermophila (strain SB210) TaxID=312017 RepID=I7LXE5_TETTS|nr:cation channel family protein [Tetrahymena thermophila SB210]EAS04476.2 cation channel family protein [Tetrahymena thermophila SB210]|eukprot:XP_001024721.2 cation channel family protein [Tetrahymena thermophila SB210]